MTSPFEMVTFSSYILRAKMNMAFKWIYNYFKCWLGSSIIILATNWGMTVYTPYYYKHFIHFYFGNHISKNCFAMLFYAY